MKFSSLSVLASLVLVVTSVFATEAGSDEELAHQQLLAQTGLTVAAVAAVGKAAHLDVELVGVKSALDQIDSGWARHYAAPAREGREKVLELLDDDLAKMVKDRRLTEEEAAPVITGAKALFAKQTQFYWGCSALDAILPHLGQGVEGIAAELRKAGQLGDTRIKACAITLCVREGLARALAARLVADNLCPPPSDDK